MFEFATRWLVCLVLLVVVVQSERTIKGMKWGVRRYQNPDGTLTAAGKKKIQDKRRFEKTVKSEHDIDNIVSSLSEEDRKYMGFSTSNELYKTPDEYKLVAYRYIQKYGDTPIAFFDLNEYDSGLNAVVATRKGEQYRSKGYATNAVKRGLAWYDKHKDQLNKPIIWWVEKENIGSRKLAEKTGFKRDRSIEKSDDEWLRNNWVKYVYD